MAAAWACKQKIGGWRGVQRRKSRRQNHSFVQHTITLPLILRPAVTTVDFKPCAGAQKRRMNKVGRT
jgi:hypothetical protein